MAKNDKKISDLLSAIQLKKSALGVKPKASWKTNGILKLDKDNHININTVNLIETCVNTVALLLAEKSFRKEASELLGVAYSDPNEDYVNDFKLRAAMITWDMEKRKLDALESQLKDLRSEDAKTADALSDIIQKLQV